MIDTQARPRPYFALLGTAAILGLATAVITFIFVAVVGVATDALWGQAAAATGLPAPVWTLLVCTSGGLLVGILVRIFGDHSGIFAEIMREFGRTGRFEYRHAPGILLTGLVSLVSGGSLGPEAPLADASGGLGTWLAERLGFDERRTRSLSYSGLSGMLGAFFTAPIGGALLALESAQGGASGVALYFWTLFPSLLSAAVATVAFVTLTHSYFGQLYAFPDYVPAARHMLQAVPLGVIGGAVGVLFFLFLGRLQTWLRPMKSRLVLRGLLGGVGMGIAGALLPLVLFSGEVELLELIERAAELGVAMLIVLAFVKLFVTCLILATGWKGGYIFPVLFVGAALGLAAHLLFPAIPMAVAVAATMAGALAATMRAPLFAILMTVILVERETAPAVAVAVVTASLFVAFVQLMMSRRAAVGTPTEAAAPQ
jgi:H+/Cl- antiporter ClcA